MTILKKHMNYKHYKPMIGSFLLAVLLWVAVTTDKIYTIHITVPLQIKQVAPGYVLKEMPPRYAVLKVRGKGRALITLYFYKPKINLELPQIKRSTTLHLMDYANQIYVGQDLGVHLEDIIQPREIKLKVDRYTEMPKPVKIKHQIKPLPGFVLSGIRVKPDSVQVGGPVSLVKKISFIVSESIKRENVRYPFDAQLNLISPKPGILHLSPQYVSVHFDIEQIVERTVYNIPIQIIGLPPGLDAKAEPPVVSVRVKGSEQKVAALTRDQITAVFDYQKEYRMGRSYYAPHMEVSDGVDIIKVIPKSFHLLLRKKEENQ
jgi:YbbR domain-containing protein